jgi:aspartate kinase
VEISSLLAKGNRDDAKKRIDALEDHYKNFVKGLVTSNEAIASANEILKEHFEFLNIILKISFSEALNKDIPCSRRSCYQPNYFVLI